MGVEQAPRPPTCLIQEDPQLSGSLMSPDTVQCPLRWGRHSITLEKNEIWPLGGEVTQAPKGSLRTQARARRHCIWGWDSAPSPVGGGQDTADGRNTKPTSPLSSPAKRQTVQVHDSMQSPGSILSPFHKGGTLGAQEAAGHPEDQQASCPKAPRPSRDWSLQPG